MKKFYSVSLCALISIAYFTKAQTIIPQGAESAPVVLLDATDTENSRALWDLVFSYNMQTMPALPGGYAGVALFNNEFWVSKWASDSIFKFTASGSFIKALTINGLSGVRAFTTDGLYLYASNNTNQIFRINAVLEQLAPNHITLNPGINTAARFCSYDSTLNTGAGGFWVGSFTSDLIAIDKSGNYLDSIPASVHGLTGMYGAAVDNYSAGGPYIWVFDQGGANACRVVRISVATGLATDVHEVYPDLQAANGLSSALAGGAFVTDKLVPGEVVFVGMLQGSPNNVLFGYDADETPNAVGHATDVEILAFPNPTDGQFTFTLPNADHNASYKLMDVTGQLILEGYAKDKSTTLEMSALANGAYCLTVYENGASVANKLVIKN